MFSIPNKTFLKGGNIFIPPPMGSTCPGFQREVFPSSAWKLQGLKLESSACYVGFLVLSFRPLLNVICSDGEQTNSISAYILILCTVDHHY